MPHQDTATNALVAETLPLVGYAVRELMSRIPPYIDRDDLVSAGSLALVQAAQAYDPATGVPFARYAAIRIRGALLDELRSKDWASRGTRNRAKQVTDVAETLRVRLGRPATREEVAAALGMSVAEVDTARADAGRKVVSLDAAVDAVGDTLADPSAGPEDHTLSGEQTRYLRAAVRALPEHLRTLVEALYFTGKSATDVAAERGVTLSRVSQMRAEALGLIRGALHTHLDPDLLATPERPAGAAGRRRAAYYATVGQLTKGAPAVPEGRRAPVPLTY